MNYVCHCCGRSDTNIEPGPNYVINCGACCKKYSLIDVKTYYTKVNNHIFAISWSLVVDSTRCAVVESYFEGSADVSLRNKSCIYVNIEGESQGSVSIPGHPFNCENVKAKTRTYLLLS